MNDKANGLAYSQQANAKARLCAASKYLEAHADESRELEKGRPFRQGAGAPLYAKLYVFSTARSDGAWLTYSNQTEHKKLPGCM